MDENTKKEITWPSIPTFNNTKGRGYKPAELSKINFMAYHHLMLKQVYKINQKLVTYTNVVSDTILKLAKKDKKIVAITAAMPSGTGLDKFKEKYPSRFL